VDASVSGLSVPASSSTLLPRFRALLEPVMTLPIPPRQRAAIRPAPITGSFARPIILRALRTPITRAVPLELNVLRQMLIPPLPALLHLPSPHPALKITNVPLWDPSTDFPAARMGSANAGTLSKGLLPAQINADVMILTRSFMTPMGILNAFLLDNALLEDKT